MGFTGIFLARPVLALVVSVLIALAGIKGFSSIEIRQFPALQKTTIGIVTAYPGASAELVQGFVTAPIQQAVAAVDGVDFITSETQQGVSQVTINVKMSFDANITMVQVLSALAQVKGILPVQSESPVVTKTTGETISILYFSFFSDSMSAEQITEYVTREVQAKLQTLEGVAQAQVLGEKRFAMRVWLDEEKLAAHGMDLLAAVEAIQSNNYLSSVGRADGDYVQISLSAKTDLRDLEGFKNLVIRSDGNTLVRLSDVARVELGAEVTDSEVIYNGKPAVLVGINPAPDANPLLVAKRIMERYPDIQRQLPDELQSSLVYDATQYIEESIQEVLITLLEATAIVLLVMFLFLGSLRAVVVPLVTIPLSMIGVFFFMDALGFSINLLTLLAMVLAVGLVVDDAIVVVENVSRHIRGGMSRLEAAKVGAREITVPVIAMTITLAAVYAPIGFVGGITGALFKEFAFTLAGSVIISGIVALTLSPVMCSKVLREGGHATGLERMLERAFDRVQVFYGNRLGNSLRYRAPTVLMIITVVAGIYYLWVTTRTELAPQEDQGALYLVGTAPKSANLDFTRLYSKQVARVIDSFDETEGYFIVNGSPGPNALLASQILKPWRERARTQMQLAPLLQAELGSVAGLQMVAYQLPPLPGASGLPVQFVISSNGPFKRLQVVADEVMAKALASGLFAFAEVGLKTDTPAVTITIDRALANQLGLSMQAIGIALSTAYSGAYVARFSMDQRSYKVIPQLDRGRRLEPEMLRDIRVTTSLGKQVPLGAVVSFEKSVQPNKLTQFQQLNSTTVSALLAPGANMGEAVRFLESQAQALLPSDFSYDFKGQSRQYVQEGEVLLYTFLFAIIVIYLVLVAQFESLRDPFIILLTVPMAIAGALLPLNLGFGSINIYTQIGFVTLIGLISKQGILMVDFANHLQRAEGLSVSEAIRRASAVRLRPILMTAVALVIAVIPLILASGPGAASRNQLGLTVFFGMSIGTLLSLFAVPVMYSFLAEDKSGQQK